MASTPPPFDPSAQKWTAHERARSAREQARVAREAARTARRQAKSAPGPGRRRSILGPVVVTTLGIVLLCSHLGVLQKARVLAWLHHWWPLLLFFAGVVLLVEWAWDEAVVRPRHPGTLPMRRGGGASAVTLVLLIIALAALHHQDRAVLLARLRDLSLDHGAWTRFLGQEHDQTDTLELPLSSGAALAISNPNGAITISGSSTDGRIHLEVHKRVYTDTEFDTARQFNALTPVPVRSGDSLSLSVPALSGGNADLVLSIPATAAVTLSSERGEIQVSDLLGSVQVASGRGDVTLRSVGGNSVVRLGSRHASLIAQELRGSFQVSGTAQDLTIAKVAGKVTVQGDFYGDTHFEQLDGPVSFQTSRTSLSLGGLPGSVEITPRAELTGEGISGPLVLATRSRDLDFKDVQGDIRITNRNGSVDITLAQLAGDLSVQNQNGSINLTLPDSASARIHAVTRDGSIADEFSLQPMTDGNASVLSGQLGGGERQINLATSDASIGVHRQ